MVILLPNFQALNYFYIFVENKEKENKQLIIEIKISLKFHKFKVLDLKPCIEC